MSWIRDTFQEYHIGRTKSVANQTQVKSHSNATDIGYIDKKIDNLVLITQAIWELLEESGISESQLEKKIHEIDLGPVNTNPIGPVVPEGLGLFLRPAALSFAHVAKLHHAHSALLDTKTDPAGHIGLVLTGPKRWQR
ncbi:MAG: hypothetical protein N0E44_14285 [Candidatus Thiodiazotropha lotti]|nr:hypothetical protein [Candidatus Thiodiazotropha lotti]MCW4221055.1 hypothetical protein [Candidatus Thiodiazotropha lotti]